MSEKRYTPTPTDVSDVQLPEEISALAEIVAKNVHEVWAAGRLQDGWTYGEVRDDATRKHPCLIPYEDLTEEEKDFDRRTSQETLKLIMKLGFRITKE